MISSVKEDDDDNYQLEGGAHKDKYAQEKEDALNGFSAPEGMNRDRGCTDCLCTFIFIGFLGSMLYLTFMGYKAGQIPKLIAPVSSNFELCGWKNET
jgi:hypothetical protein